MELTKQALSKMAESYKHASTQHVAEQAVKNNGIHASAEREQATVTDNNFVFSIDVDDEAVANQLQSGRCWMYACLNVLRHHIEKSLKLKKGSFQLSQNYNFFFDKLEKCNFFMENIVKYAGSDLNDRRIDFLLATPQQDGGDWDPVCALVDKYGVVPLEAMPDTAVTKNTSELNAVINRLLRQDAFALRDLVNSKASEKSIEEARNGMMEDIYRVLAVSMGVPPEKFDFEYRDKDNVYHVDRDLTPIEFYKKYVGYDLADYVGVINLPLDDMPYNHGYTIDMTGDVLGSKRFLHYVNVPLDVMKEATIKQLKAGEPVWFGCDVTQDSDFQKGIMSLNLYDIESMFGIDFTMDKAQNFLSNQSLPTHAMVIAGVDLDADGKPVRWKVENSWGAKDSKGNPVGHNGYFIMDDSWFDVYNYEVAVKKEYLPADAQKALEEEPTVLPYWNTFNPEP